MVLCTVGIPVWSLSPGSGDFLKAAPVAAKVVLPLAFIPEMAGDADALIPGLVGISIFTVPNSFLMYNVIKENPVGTSFWRKVTFYTDAAAGLGLAGWGIYMLADSADTGGWNIIAGGMMILLSLPVFGAAAVDIIPYSFEY